MGPLKLKMCQYVPKEHTNLLKNAIYLLFIVATSSSLKLNSAVFCLSQSAETSVFQDSQVNTMFD